MLDFAHSWALRFVDEQGELLVREPCAGPPVGVSFPAEGDVLPLGAQTFEVTARVFHGTERVVELWLKELT